MENTEKHIELYPGHWLYNASVIGFLKSIESIEKKIKDSTYFTFDSGALSIERNLFDDLKTEIRYFSDKLCDCLLIGNVSKTSKTKYPNYINPSNKGDKEGFNHFVKELSKLESGGTKTCPKCGQTFHFKNSSTEKLNREWNNLGGANDGFEKFINSVTKVSNRINESLGGADSYPNGYWAGKHSTELCPLCSYLIIHHHIALIKLIDGSKLFINAPSFSIMYKLNTLLEKLIDKENVSYKNLLAMSIIEFSIKTNVLMNSWAGMNIEIVAIQKNGVIEFISLPYETIRILSNKRIAEILSAIGEFKILNMVTDGRWKDLIELGYRILKIAMKPSSGKEDQNFIENNFFRYENRETRNLKELANKLLKLYALIEERTKTKQNEYIY
jgi:CRISPR-associated protein Cst1